MSYLPPVGWADVATKHDLDAQTLLLRTEIENRTTLLRTEMGKLGAELRQEIADGRAEVSDKIAGLQRTMINLMFLLTAIFSAISTIVAIVA